MLFENPKNCSYCPLEMKTAAWVPGRWWGIIKCEEYPQFSRCVVEGPDRKLETVSFEYMEVVRP